MLLDNLELAVLKKLVKATNIQLVSFFKTFSVSTSHLPFLFTVAESRFVLLGRVSCHHVEGPIRDRENQLIALTVIPRCSHQPKLEHETGTLVLQIK